MDWEAWHSAYDDPSSPLAARLRQVRLRLKRTVEASAAMCTPGATVIWTRHRLPPDLTPQVRAWFAASGFSEVAFDAPESSTMIGLGANRLRHAATAGLPDRPLFTFGRQPPTR